MSCGVWRSFPVDLVAGLVSAGIVFALGLLYPIIIKAIQAYHLRRFWGKEAQERGIIICYGAFQDSRLFEPNRPQFRFVKRRRDGSMIKFVGPWGNVVADAEVRGASYISNTIGKFRKEPIGVMADGDVLGDLKRTIVSLGSSSSNDITDLILHEPNNTFLEFGQEAGTFLIIDKKTGQKFRGFQEPVKRDLGIVLNGVNP